MTITFSYLSLIFLDVILFLTIVPTIYLILNDKLTNNESIRDNLKIEIDRLQKALDSYKSQSAPTKPTGMEKKKERIGIGLKKGRTTLGIFFYLCLIIL